ncbi:hypothetical protein MAPG_09579 [Magnaporthiopsis poae ATCC 64411]|uniref:Heterokaryon incompatibility domain-containing protein n=1 Tax=Magnaporthiopsis poae (strain ATCC 64411 / 73-15) TaxID=644358 RepID=A0A0C4EAB5_MAGP6|nr:hypothetical protein MAPG_09579 [Magnaporthiopsis poae ATCC 64411]
MAVCSLCHGAQKPRRLGFPHQPDLQSLQTAAVGCSLCRLILGQIDLVVEEFRVVSQQSDFQKFYPGGYPRFDLFLVRRQNTGHGFLILCHGITDDFIYVLGAIGLSVRDDDPLAAVMPGRVLDGALGVKTTLRRAAKWLRACNKHRTCLPWLSPLPRRVIDVGENSDSRTVRLVEPPAETRARYVALSHCWGRSSLPLTTTENKPQRLRGIGLGEMSRSFEDAIMVTRSLRVRYIWIDSLCIVQNDAQDWDAEAAKMHLVYSNSFLTLSITGAKDGTIGCFHRAPREYPRLPYMHKTGIYGEVYACAVPVHKEVETREYINMDDEPLSARGWCFQERVLSRRILHFASDQMYFECTWGFRSEDGLHLPSRFPYTDEMQPIRRTIALGAWYRYIEMYGPRVFTKGSDKLPAIGGIAAMFAKNLNDQYIAGIWRSDVIQGLLWQGLGVTDVEDDRVVPSWSWAAINGTPAYGGVTAGEWAPMASVLDCQVELEGKSAFGRVKSGCIKMKAPLLPVVLTHSRSHPKDTTDGFPHEAKSLSFRTSQGTGLGSYAASTLSVGDTPRPSPWREKTARCSPWSSPKVAGRDFSPATKPYWLYQ